MVDLILLAIAFVSYLGCIIGCVLSLIAPEEIVPGRRYFVAGRIFLLIILASLVAYGAFLDQLWNLLVAAAVLSLAWPGLSRYNINWALSLLAGIAFGISAGSFIFMPVAAVSMILLSVNSAIFSEKYVHKEAVSRKMDLFLRSALHNLPFFVGLIFLI